MSSALPMALRPSCAALRPSAPVSQQWNTVTQAFARRFCSRSRELYASSKLRPSIFSTFKSHNHLRTSSYRTFISTPSSHAEVSDAPSNTERIAAGALQAKQRKVTIGPLPDGPLSKAQIQKIFGSNISTNEGNNILRILHHRRTSGSLIDHGIDNLGARYDNIATRNQKLRALKWLRNEYPVDEAHAAEEWAEKEANRIAYELWLADPENADSKYNDPARVFKEQQDKEAAEKQEMQEIEEEESGQRMGMLRMGKSQFEENIKRKRRERLEEAARLAAEKEAEKERREKEMEEKIASGEWVRTPSGTQLMKPHQTTYVDVFGREQVSRRKEELEKYQKKAESGFKSPEEMLKATTLTQRLLPMTLLVTATLLISYAAAHYYVPPAPEYRFYPNLSISTATIAALVATNVVVCMLWRVGPLWPLMTKYFMHVPGYPRAIQAIGNVFSHVQYEHLFSNMMFLGLIGYACCELVGRSVFLSTYMSAGAFGTLVSLYWSNVGKGNPAAHSVGASAAIWGIAALYCLLTDAETIKIPVVRDMEVAFWPKTVFAAFVVMEIITAAKSMRPGVASTMDHASHFGGMIVGTGVAGYMRATGWHGRRAVETAGESKTVDVGAMVKEEVGEIKEGVKTIVGTGGKKE